jgi:acyl dehydratase
VTDNTTKETGPVPTVLYYEDLVVGQENETAPRLVTQETAEHFAEVEGHKSPLHLDPEYAKSSVFGELTVHGVLIIGMAIGIMGDTGLFDGTATAFLGIDWKFIAPVRVGDSLHVRWKVSSKRLSSKPGRGVVVRNLNVLNQNDQTVATGDWTSLWACRGQ